MIKKINKNLFEKITSKIKTCKIGEGSYSNVYPHPNLKNRVIKVTKRFGDIAAFTFLKSVAKGEFKRNKKNYPKVYKLLYYSNNGNVFFICIMERLTPLTKIKRNSVYKIKLKNRVGFSWWELEEKLLKRTSLRSYMYKKNNECQLLDDLHEDNVLLRYSPKKKVHTLSDLVLVDPVY